MRGSMEEIEAIETQPSPLSCIMVVPEEVRPVHVDNE
jgi:hypothetical protein